MTPSPAMNDLRTRSPESVRKEIIALHYLFGKEVERILDCPEVLASDVGSTLLFLHADRLYAICKATGLFKRDPEGALDLAKQALTKVYEMDIQGKM